MTLAISKENCQAVLSTYHGFHDAEIRSLLFTPVADGKGRFHCDITLLCRNQENKSTETVVLSLANIDEFKWSYNNLLDYPNIRDDIAIGVFNDQFCVDFGSACEARTSLEEYRLADSYFICGKVTLCVAGR